MRCPVCGTGNAEDQQFCSYCGAALPDCCPDCGQVVAADTNFCGNCGASLDRLPRLQRPSATPGAERRHLTVMFCDLVGSTALSARLDPEDLRDVIHAFHDCCTDAVTRFDGRIAKYMGDGVLVYFGFPQAHEDDAERAVSAALWIADHIGTCTPQPDLHIQVRIGIATGTVVVGDSIGTGPAREQAVIGETPNRAERLQSSALPDTVLIDATTRQLIGDLFECADLGALPLKGYAEPVRAWRVVGEGRAGSRFEALRTTDAAPLVGRDDELAVLLGCWRQAKAGAGRVMLLSGDPGIGKSRLAQAVHERLRGEPHLRLRLSCSPYHRNSVLYPVIAHVERAAGLARGDPPNRKLDKLEALFAQSAGNSADIVPLTAALVGIPTGTRYPPPDPDPARAKERTLAALVEQLPGLAARQPLLMVWEDIHWCDATSLDLLGRVIDRARTLPALVLVTFRPDYVPPWDDAPHIVRLRLDRLDPAKGAAVARAAAGGRALPPPLLRDILTKSDGVPLFIEELTKTVLESGLLHRQGNQYALNEPIRPLAIPATLHGSLLARLDRLPAAVKEAAQIAAALGRDISHDLLAAVVPRPDLLPSALNRLTEAELIVRDDGSSRTSYRFKHALVQEAAYGTLLRGRRRQLHQRIAEALEQHFSDLVTAHPELLAHHWIEAGNAGKAIGWLQQAGQIAVRRSALPDALAHLTRALELLDSLPDTPERWLRELDLRLALGGVLIAVKGIAAPETGRAYARAHALCRQFGQPPQIFRALYGKYVFHLARAELDAALASGQELLDLAERQPLAVPRIIGHRAVGNALFSLGHLQPAREHLEQAVGLYDPEAHRSLAFLYAYDPCVTSLNHLSWALAILGYPDQARQRSRAAVAWARELNHPNSIGQSLMFQAMLHQFLRDRATVEQAAQAMIALAQEQGFPLRVAAGMLIEGWVLCQSGQRDTGLARLREGLEGWRGTGSELAVPYYQTLIAEACDNRDEAEALLADGLERVERTGERWIEAELYRVQGDVRRARPDQAEACYRRALVVARDHGARLWELRAALRLAGLWRAQGRRDEARRVLEPACGWFTEGFDIPDLREAKALRGR